MYQALQLQLVSPSLSCSTVSSILKQGRSTYPSFRFLSILLGGLPRQQSQQFGKLSFFVFSLIITRSGRLAEIRWSVFISRSQRSLYVSFSGADSRLCIHYLFACSNFNFLHSSQWIPFPTQSYLVFFSFFLFFLFFFFLLLLLFHRLWVLYTS